MAAKPVNGSWLPPLPCAPFSTWRVGWAGLLPPLLLLPLLFFEPPPWLSPSTPPLGGGWVLYCAVLALSEEEAKPLIARPAPDVLNTTPSASVAMMATRERRPERAGRRLAARAWTRCLMASSWIGPASGRSSRRRWAI